MGVIVAARFQEQEHLDKAIEALSNVGVNRERMSGFYVNPPGQHDMYAIGGDRNDSPGAHETGTGVAKGAATGGTLGMVAGLTGAAVFGPIGPAVGALVGAHIGGLVGGLSEMKEKGEDEKGTSDGPGTQNELAQRKSGMLLGVALDVLASSSSGTHVAGREEIIRVLQSCGGQDVELADGSIVDGDWVDFDPLLTPAFITPPNENRTS